MKKFLLPVVVVIFALGLVVTMTYVIARAQGEDGSPWPGTRPTTQEDSGSADIQGPVEDAVLSPDQWDSDLRISGSVFRPRDSDVGWQQGGEGGCIYATSGSTTEWFNAPVYLSDGSTVRRLRMYYNDTHATHDSRGYFTVYDLYGNIVEEWGVSSSGSGGENFRLSEIFTHTVDYDSYSYVINWQPNELGNDMQLCGFRIEYKAPPGAIFLPMIRN